MLLRPNVIDLVGQHRVGLSKLTVLAFPTGAYPDTLAAKLRHGLLRGAILLERQSGFRLQQIEELTNPQVLFQHHALIRGDRSSIVLPQQLANVFGRIAVEPELQEGPGRLRVQVGDLPKAATSPATIPRPMRLSRFSIRERTVGRTISNGKVRFWWALRQRAGRQLKCCGSTTGPVRDLVSASREGIA
jgi:hypothetical protein